MMNKIQNILAGSALLLTALAACSDPNEAENPSTDHQAVMLNVSIEADATLSDDTRADARGMQAHTRADGKDIAYTPDANVDLHLYHGAVGSGDHAIYHYSATAWQAAGHPLYWDDLSAATIADGETGRLYSFYAVVNPTTFIGSGSAIDYANGIVSHLQGETAGTTTEQAKANYAAADLMMAYTYTERRTTTAPIAFTLKHLMAQLTITLENDPAAKGDALFTDRQLADATATTQLRPGYALTYHSTGSKADAEQAKSAPATAAVSTTGAGAAPADFTLLRTVHYANNADGTDPTATVEHVSFTCIAPAQELGAVTITIDGRNYTFTPGADAITLAAGVNTVQPLIAKKTGLAPGAVTVTDWVDDPQGSADLSADGINPATESLTGIEEAGTLRLFAYKENDGTLIGTGVYPVTYDASGKGSAAINTADGSGYQPLFWDHLPKYATGSTLQSYTYAATYVPTGYRLAINPANAERHEKDLLASLSTAPWGTTPSFADGGSGNDTRLQHLMARFTVKLTCTDGTYTAAELNAAQLTTVRKATVDAADPLPVNINGVALNIVSTKGDPVADNTVTLVKTVAATAGSADTDNIAQYTAILAPQTLTADTDADQTVLRLSISGAAGTKEYSLKKAVTLKGGEDYVLTATLTKTALNMGSITVKPWDDSTTGSGDFEM